MKILIIEDEPSIRETIRDILEIHGHTVLEAGDGHEGLALAQQGPDLILCDIGLPAMDGFQVIEAVQQQPACRDIPFIFLTARASRDDQRLGMELGADDYLTKPFTEEEIVRAIDARVRRQRPLKERLQKLLDAQRLEIEANWSHELMTPLNGLLGGLDMIEEEAADLKVSDIKDLLRLVREGARRQERLSRKLVLHYELERVKYAPPSRPSQCDAQSAVMAGAQRAAEQEGRSRDLSVMATAAQVSSVESYLATAVAEVVSNAFRFSQPGQAVIVTGHQEGARYLIEVRDSGAGLTKEQCEKIHSFVQFGRENRDLKGLGLGLSIARSVAELAGGGLRIEPGVPRGLRVTFDLPCVE